jgi:hypothetical protein
LENNQVALTALADGATSNIYNNVIESDYGAQSEDATINALIIKNVALTNINDLQALI